MVGMNVQVNADDPTSQLRSCSAGLHRELQPASDTRIMVVTPSPRRWDADGYYTHTHTHTAEKSRMLDL